MKIFSLFIVGLLSVQVAVANDVDFQNRQLIKSLEKLNQSFSALEEIELTKPMVSKLNGEGKYFHVKNTNPGESVKYAYVGRVHSCRSGGCSDTRTTTQGGSEYFDYFVLYAADFSVVQVKVFNYQATHGQEITLKAWLRQFENYNGTQDLIVGKQIDGIAGATISVNGITSDIRQKTQLLKELVE